MTLPRTNTSLTCETRAQPQGAWVGGVRAGARACVRARVHACGAALARRWRGGSAHREELGELGRVGGARVGELKVEVLVHAGQRARDLQVVLQLHRYRLAFQRLEKGEEDHRDARRAAGGGEAAADGGGAPEQCAAVTQAASRRRAGKNTGGRYGPPGAQQVQ